MRGSNRMKKILSNNRKNLATISITSVTMDIVVGYMYLYTNKIFSFVALSLFQYFLLFMLFYRHMFSVNEIIDNVKTMVFVDDINTNVTSIVSTDCIYIFVAFKAFFRTSYYGLLLLLLFPICIGYEIVYKPFYSTTNRFDFNKKE